MSTTIRQISRFRRSTLALAALLAAGAIMAHRPESPAVDIAPPGAEGIRRVAPRSDAKPVESGRIMEDEHVQRALPTRLLAQIALLDAQPQREAIELFEAYQAAFAAEMNLGHFTLVASLIEKTPRVDVRALLGGAIAGVWARHAPDEAARWLLRLCSEAPCSVPAITEVAGIWAARDPQAAAAFAASLETSSLRSAALASVASQWAARDVAAAGEWLATHAATSDFDPAVVALLRSPAWDGEASSAAMRLAETVSDTQLRLETMAHIARRWLAYDAVSARRHLLASAFVLSHADRFAAALSERSDRGDE